ncbi:unnamed protein product [Linum tenue]|uniref:Secreted protein n=1 Tax=Linum tenue TaxID=586396 RepID=A0AAV0JWK1_9ROSI|nr:unnamed protein product [Linum tenue]
MASLLTASLVGSRVSATENPQLYLLWLSRPPSSQDFSKLLLASSGPLCCVYESSVPHPR